MNVRARGLIQCFALVCMGTAGAAALIGCTGDNGSTTISLNNGGTTTITGNRAAKELTLNQGQKLLAEIAKDPKRLDKMTPEEKRFLQKALAAKAVQKQEKDQGR